MEKINTKDSQPAGKLQEVYSRIAALGLNTAGQDFLKQLNEKHTALYNELGEVTLAFVTRAVNGTLRQRAVETCTAGCLDMADVTSELSLRLLAKTGRFVAQLWAGQLSMACVYRCLCQGLTDLWRSQTKHWGRSNGVDGNGEKTFTQGYFLDSLEGLLENAYEPLLNQPSSAAAPEEVLLQSGFREDAGRVYQILRQTLTKRQLAALLIKAERHGLDPELASAWSNGLNVTFSDARARDNAAYAAGKKLRAVKDEIYRIFE